MISIIICSRKADIPDTLKQNIAATIGCEHEFVVVDNSHNDYTIFTAYNEGVKHANGDILCFMHEDVIFRSQGWGEMVVNNFADKSIGCIGVIGSWFLPNKMASWWLCNATKGHLLQGYIGDDGAYRTFQDGEKGENDIEDVAVVDGCWFCIPKQMFEKIRFDDQTYRSFHCYDVDICMQVIKEQKRVVVCNNVDIEHQSLGNVLSDYYEQLAVFYSKWQTSLPYSADRQIPESTMLWVSDILSSFQRTVQRKVVLENSKSYKLGRTIIGSMAKLKKKYGSKK